MRSLGIAWVNVNDLLEVRYVIFGEAQESILRFESERMAKFVADQLNKYFQDCTDKGILP